MAIDKKTRVGNRKITILTILIILLILFLFLTEYQTVEIIYFTNPKCGLTETTDDYLEEMKEDFDDRIHIRKIIVSMYADDPPDTEEIEELREKYVVTGVPEIIINGKEFTERITKDRLKERICESFIVQPEVC